MFFSFIINFSLYVSILGIVLNEKFSSLKILSHSCLIFPVVLTLFGLFILGRI